MLKDLLERYSVLGVCKAEIVAARDALVACYERGGKVLLAGNGGSASDCDHIVGELMKGFLKKRPLSDEKKAQMKANYAIDDDILNSLEGGLAAVSLPAITGLNTAFSNDVDPHLIYAQAVLGLGKAGDILIALSTSGGAKNVLAAVGVAKSIGMTVIGMTGKRGGRLREMADIAIAVPESETFKVQELHLPIYHYLCAAVEAHFFDR